MNTQLDTTTTTQPSAPTGYPMAFEVTTLPVADVDRAKAFYLSLGWRLDIDFMPSPDTRGVQITPPGSPASIQFGSGPAAATSGPLTGLLLIVDDIEAARDDLIRRGVDVSEIFAPCPARASCRASIPSAAHTSAARSSRTPTATSGSSRRSPSGSRGGSSRVRGGRPATR